MKYLLLGVAQVWEKRKGLDVFVVLVGTNEKNERELPSNIISIHRTQNQRELAEIYTAADVLVNPTRDEALGMVNIEALACGTPVLTFRTGGSPECIDESCGAVVDCGDVDALEAEIRRICETKPFSEKACLERANGFDQDKLFEEYVRLYQEAREVS